MIRLQEFPRKRLFTHYFISPATSLMTPVKELDRRYRCGLKRAMVLGLFISLLFFHFSPKKFLVDNKFQFIDTIDLIVEEIPRTEQLAIAPRPPRPVVPIPTEDEDVPEDLTIAATDINFDELPPPAPPPPDSEEDEFIFIAYDSPPEPIGGFSSLLKLIKYPEIARRSGVESTVIVGVLVDIHGNSSQTKILKDSGGKLGFEEEAEKAVKKMKWKPALQRDKPIKVWISVPVVFRIAS